VFIGAEAQKLLRRYLFGVNYKPASYRRAITRTCDKTYPTELTGDALKKWRREHRFHPHQLRHNFGTMVRAKFGLEHAQVALGQASANVTEIFALRDEMKAREVAAKVG
jgi:integrase